MSSGALFYYGFDVRDYPKQKSCGVSHFVTPLTDGEIPFSAYREHNCAQNLDIKEWGKLPDPKQRHSD